VTRHLLVAGAQRCGTTYLHDLLAAHPRIAMARPARPEPKVFLSEELAARGLGWYESTYFGHAGDAVLLGEKSTSYLEYPDAAQRAAAVLGDPLVLVQLRDPVERAVSHWAFSTGAGLEARPLAEALSANLAGPQPWDAARTSVSPYAYLERGHYAGYLEPWLDAFGDDLHVLFLEELTADPDAVGALYGRLGVDEAFRPPEAAEPVNASGYTGPGLPDDLRARLREHFRDSDRALEQLLGRRLPWAGQDIR
jgi:sulfotransferase family protein